MFNIPTLFMSQHDLYILSPSIPQLLNPLDMSLRSLKVRMNTLLVPIFIIPHCNRTFPG